MTASRENKEALNIPDDTKNIAFQRVNEKILFEENTTKISSDYIGHSFILGHPVNGYLGTGYLGVDGQQIVLGDAGRIVTLLKVVNQNNIFRERFMDTSFKSTTTANWDTTNQRLAMSSSNNHATVYNTKADIDTFFYNNQTVSKITANWDETKWNSNDSIRFFISANGGTNYEEVVKGVESTLTTTGNHLKGRIIFFGNGGSDTYIENLSVTYS